MCGDFCAHTCCGPRGMKVWASLSALVAIAFFSLAVYLPHEIDNAIDKGITDAITITSDDALDGGTKEYRTFTNPDDPDSTPVYYKVKMWHLTNAADVLTGALPDYVERGPYTYRKKTYKKSVVFSQNVYKQNLMSYKTQTAYYFEPSMSCAGCTEADNVTNVNLIWVLQQGSRLGTLYRGLPPPLVPASYQTDIGAMFQTRTVGEWFWGYSDPVLRFLRCGTSPTCDNVACPLCPFAIPAIFPGVLGPNQLAFDLNQKTSTIFVGTQPDQQVLREYVQYEGQEDLETQFFDPTLGVYTKPTWATGVANRVHGTDGTQFRKGIQAGETIFAFVSQLTRTATLGNIGNEKIKFKDIDMLRFTLPNIFLQNAAVYDANADYYMLGYAGLANLTAVGKPGFYVSKPRFLDCDPAIRGNLSATFPVPNYAEHDTFLNIEPTSGATMQAAKRLQLSVNIKPTPYGFYPGGNTSLPLVTGIFGAGLANGGLQIGPGGAQAKGMGLYMPIFWAEESAEIKDDDASAFVKSLYGAQNASYAIYIAGEVLGCFFVVFACVLFWVSATRTGPPEAFSVTGRN